MSVRGRRGGTAGQHKSASTIFVNFVSEVLARPRIPLVVCAPCARPGETTQGGSFGAAARCPRCGKGVDGKTPARFILGASGR